jgi:hypothetical protein
MDRPVMLGDEDGNILTRSFPRKRESSRRWSLHSTDKEDHQRRQRPTPNDGWTPAFAGVSGE